jgi:hypothetical protein
MELLFLDQMIIKESEARSDIYIGSESHDHPP